MELEPFRTGYPQITALDFAEPLPASVLNVEDKSRSNPLAWRGQFTPQLVEALLKAYGPESGCVLDPFVGSGTVLAEASRLGLAAVGCEVNPAAMLLARTYEFANYNEAKRRLHVQEAEQALQRHIPADLPLFDSVEGRESLSVCEAMLAALSETLSDEARSLLTTLALTLDVARVKTSAAALWDGWYRLVRLVYALPYSSAPVRSVLADARAIPVPVESIDLVITSPPYINVFNYHQNYRKTAEALGWRPLEVAKTEIGSNRKFRSNRFLTVVQYCIDMGLVLEELRRVCRPDARIIIVVGRESNVRKTPFYNANLIIEVARRALGYNVLQVQERVFSNKFGQDIYEDIVHLSLPAAQVSVDRVLEVAREVAAQALSDALERAPLEATNDIQAAMRQISTVAASPELCADRSHISSAEVSRTTSKAHPSPQPGMTIPTPHLEKINAALLNEKLPKEDVAALQGAIRKHSEWVRKMRDVLPVDVEVGRTVEQVVVEMVELLNEYKLYMDLDVIFDSNNDFLYRQKGQLKLDNSIIEEFLPHLVDKTIPGLLRDYAVGPTKCYSTMYFQSVLGRDQAGGGPRIRDKDQDFAISRKLYIKTAHEHDFSDEVMRSTQLGLITAECKTNLDKTMFQEASATAHDVKSAVPGAKYYLLAEWLDMTPISTAPTRIDEVLLLRGAKRMSSNVRRDFSNPLTRRAARGNYEAFLRGHPFRADVFLRFVSHIIGVLEDEDPVEEDVLVAGYF